MKKYEKQIVITLPPITLIDIEEAEDFIDQFQKKNQEQENNPQSEKWNRSNISVGDQAYMKEIVEELIENIKVNPPASQDPKPNESNFLYHWKRKKNLSKIDRLPEESALLTLDHLVCTILYPLYMEKTPEILKLLNDRLLDWRTIHYGTISLIVEEYFHQFYLFWKKIHRDPRFDDCKISMVLFENYIIESFYPYSKYSKKYNEIYLMTAEIILLSALAQKKKIDIPKITRDNDLVQDILLLIEKLLPYPPFRPTFTFIDPFLIGLHFPPKEMLIRDYQIYKFHHIRRL